MILFLLTTKVGLLSALRTTTVVKIRNKQHISSKWCKQKYQWLSVFWSRFYLNLEQDPEVQVIVYYYWIRSLWSWFTCTCIAMYVAMVLWITSSVHLNYFYLVICVLRGELPNCNYGICRLSCRVGVVQIGRKNSIRATSKLRYHLEWSAKNICEKFQNEWSTSNLF